MVRRLDGSFGEKYQRVRPTTVCRSARGGADLTRADEHRTPCARWQRRGPSPTTDDPLLELGHRGKLPSHLILRDEEAIEK